MIPIPYPNLDNLLDALGDAGRRLCEIEASEGAAGNISVCLRPRDAWRDELRAHFPRVEAAELPLPVPKLAGATFIVSGSGRRLREIVDDPAANLACLVVEEGGRTAKLNTAHRRRFERVTSEFNSHLAVHYDHACQTGADFHALIHAQPIHLTYLSHIPRYQNAAYLNTHLLRWQPETIINLPEGLGVVPFEVPGSPALMDANVTALQKHRLVVWTKHGVMARSDVSVKRAVDLVEYAEAAAKYEYLNLAVGEIGEGLRPEEIRAICDEFNFEQSVF